MMKQQSGPGGRILFSLVLGLFASASSPLAEVTRVEVTGRAALPAVDGAPAYERLSGILHFAVDPGNEANRAIVDLGFAPRNNQGRVVFRSEFMVLQPRDPAQRRGVALLEVSNRGSKAALRYFNRADPSLTPAAPEHLGDGLLMRRRLTIIWVGWQFDVPDREGLLHLFAPVARAPEGPLEGLVRSDWVVEAPTRTLALGHRGHRTYPALDADDPRHQLTVRDGRDLPRRLVPRNEWQFAREEQGQVLEDFTHIYSSRGFEAGKIYELVYAARDPRVVGLGLAAVRDTASYAKYSPEGLFPASSVVAFGVSQTGRFLRQFLYQGFNRDELDRKAIDGMLIHSAGAGRGSFNHRFGQPSRDAHRFSAFFYPTDVFPFSSRSQFDPDSGLEEGLLDRTQPEHRPRVFYTNTGYEYWGRAASLIHTTPSGDADVEPLESERIFHLAGGQHSVGQFPPSDPVPGGGYRPNPVNFVVHLRALLLRLIEWVAEDQTPPDSLYPTIAAGTLVQRAQISYPPIPGFHFSQVFHQAYRTDYGDLRERGVVTIQPPRLGRTFGGLLPQVDRIGNEIGGLRPLELEVPIATYFPWSLRYGLPGPVEEMRDFVGTLIPLSRTEEERQRRRDPRPSLSSLYEGLDDFLAKVHFAAKQLESRGLLLEEDVQYVVQEARSKWEWALSRQP